MSEFTGERVIPGQVNDDLWAEHIARYAFASRFTRGKRVLDLGCGTGYGTAELAKHACMTAGVDIAIDAIAYASSHFPTPAFVQGSATALPLAADTFDVVTAFEVIEHLDDWRSMLTEAGRVLHADGLLIVSTPNKLYYAESRESAGPNPFHRHEFEYTEFGETLHEIFPHVEIFLQDRLEAFAFHPCPSASQADGYLARSSEDPTRANFFVALCSGSPIPDAHAFLYVPEVSNLLGERERHIRLLEAELAQVRGWLNETMSHRDDMIVRYKNLESELEDRNCWALELNQKWKSGQQTLAELQLHLEEHNRWALQLGTSLTAAQRRIAQLQDELEAEQQHAAGAIASLTEENLQKTRWALGLETTLTERTEWAQRLNAELTEAQQRIQRITAQVEMASRSRWLTVGRLLGLGPDFKREES